MSEWIEASRQLPRSGQSCLGFVKPRDRRYKARIRMLEYWVMGPKHFGDTGFYEKTMIYDDPVEVVTHWMPLPEPPK